MLAWLAGIEDHRLTLTLLSSLTALAGWMYRKRRAVIGLANAWLRAEMCEDRERMSLEEVAYLRRAVADLRAEIELRAGSRDSRE